MPPLWRRKPKGCIKKRKPLGVERLQAESEHLSVIGIPANSWRRVFALQKHRTHKSGRPPCRRREMRGRQYLGGLSYGVLDDSCGRSATPFTRNTVACHGFVFCLCTGGRDCCEEVRVFHFKTCFQFASNSFQKTKILSISQWIFFRVL